VCAWGGAGCTSKKNDCLLDEKPKECCSRKFLFHFFIAAMTHTATILQARLLAFDKVGPPSPPGILAFVFLLDCRNSGRWWIARHRWRLD